MCHNRYRHRDHTSDTTKIFHDTEMMNACNEEQFLAEAVSRVLRSLVQLKVWQNECACYYDVNSSVFMKTLLNSHFNIWLTIFVFVNLRFLIFQQGLSWGACRRWQEQAGGTAGSGHRGGGAGGADKAVRVWTRVLTSLKSNDIPIKWWSKF